MRGVKPFKLSFITRPFQFRRANRLGIGVIAYFDFATGSLRTDMEMWSDLPDLLGPDLALDAGVPKSRAEFLVTGSAYQPGGRPATTRPVRVAVGDQEKVLYVVGDREWKRDVPTEPLPFVRMPLTWEQAFGGEDFGRNPRGKGHVRIEDEEGDAHRPLPNVELPGHMITKRRDDPEPASFGPIPFMWPQRFEHAGTYDKDWLEELYPGFAEDIDWRLWNLASEDQQRDAPFQPGEPVVMENLHPEKPLLETRVPPLVARCFVRMRGDEDGCEEVPLRATTLWLFPEIERGIVVWHGAKDCVEDDGADVDVLMVAADAVDAPRSLEHYRAVMAKRTGPNRELEVLNDDELVPPGESGMGAEIALHTEVTSPKNLAAARQRAEAEQAFAETRSKLEEMGLDPDEHGPPAKGPEEAEVPALEDIGSLRKQLDEDVEALRHRAATHMAEAQARAWQLYQDVGLDFAEVQKEMSEPADRGPPTFTADGKRAEMRVLLEEAAARGQAAPELEHYVTDPEVYRTWKMIEERERDAYRRYGHTQWPAFVLSDERNAERVGAVRETLAHGGSMKGWDLTGADLRGLDFSGADLTEALMESSNLAGCRFVGAKLDGVVLAHANLEEAVFDEASLAHANLGGAVLVRTSFARANLPEAILEGARLEGTSFVGARVPELRVHEATVNGVDFTGAVLAGASFTKVILEEVTWSGADLTEATFLDVEASGQSFVGATLNEATLVRFRAPGADLSGARMRGLRFIEGGSLEGANLRGADLSKANLRGVILIGADLNGARLEESDLSGADLTRAKLSGIRARRSMWSRAVLRDAFMVNADLLEAMLTKADIRGADLGGANLYGADFALVYGDEETNVKGAIMDRVRAKPVRHET